MALGIPNSLPSAEKKPLDKLEKNTRQNRDTAKNRHVDIRQLVCLPLEVCRVFVSGTRQRSKFAECFSLALGKEINLSSVFSTRQTNIFFSSDLETFSALHLQHVVLHIKIWYICRSVCYI